MKKYFDRLKKGQEVGILGKNETPIKSATAQFKLPYSEMMYGEPKYWCHIKTIQKRTISYKREMPTVETKVITEGRAFFLSQLKYKEKK